MSNKAHTFAGFLNSPEFIQGPDGSYYAMEALGWKDGAGYDHWVEPFCFDGHSIPRLIRPFFRRVSSRLRVAMWHDWFFENRDKHNWTRKEVDAGYLAAGLWVCTHEGFSVRETFEWLWARTGLLLGSWWYWLKQKVK